MNQSDDKQKKMNEEGPLIFWFIMIGAFFSGSIQRYLRDNGLVSTELLRDVIGGILGYGSIFLVARWLKKYLWYQKVNGSRLFDKITTTIIFSFPVFLFVWVIYDYFK